MWLHNFRQKHRELCLQLLWDQWTALGVAGYSAARPQSPVDVEAAMLATATFGRWDARLFDAMLDWQHRHDRFINVQRLRNICNRERYAGLPALGAVARLRLRQGDRAKWKSLAEQAHPTAVPAQAFFHAMGAAGSTATHVDPDFASLGFLRPQVEFRESNIMAFDASPATLALQLRGLFGVSARAELMLYVLCRKEATLDEAASRLYFSKRSLYDTFSELQATPWFLSSASGAKKSLRLSGEMSEALLHGYPRPAWINWAARWSGLEQLSLLLDELVEQPSFDMDTEPLLLASVLGQRWKRVRTALREGDIPELPTDSSTARGVAIVEGFQQDLSALHNILGR